MRHLRAVPPPITFTIETRPSVINGFSWWATLKYRNFVYDELLPQDLPAMDEAQRDKVIAVAAERLRAQLKPVIEMEDGCEP